MSQGFQVSRGGQGPSGITSFSDVISTTGSKPVVLANPCNQIKISNYSEFPLFISFYGPASPTNYAIAPKSTFDFNGPAISQFQLNANGATVMYGCFAV